MSDIDVKLDEILAAIAGDTFDYAQDLAVMDSDRDEAVYSVNKQYKPIIKQLMVDEFEKMIGDMEYRETFDMGLSSWSNEDYKAFGRNELRIELRQKLEEFRK